MPTPQEYQAALKAVKNELEADLENVGLLWCGSAQRGAPGPTSDLDLYVVTTKRDYWRETRIVGGVTVELFHNNLASMRWRIKKDLKAAHGFATGRILFARTDDMSELTALGRERWEAGAPPLTASEVNALRYALTDRLDDLLDVEGDPFAAHLAGTLLIHQSLEVYCRLNHFVPEKPKRILAQVQVIDADLGALVTSYLTGSVPNVPLVTRIIDHVLAPVGGQLIEWCSEKVPYPPEEA